MRRLAPFLLLGTGVFMLLFAPLLRYYAVPRLELAPLDPDVTNVSAGVGRYLDPATGRLSGPTTLTATLRVLGDVAAGRAHGVAVWDVSTRVDTPDTRAGDPRKALTWTVERWAFDRRTGRSRHCCGEQPRFAGEGYLKFPFHAGRHSYDIWDSTARRSVVARYTGTTTLAGRRLYEYRAVVPALQVATRQVPGALVGQPAQSLVRASQFYRNAGESWLVDPRTGIVVTGSSHPVVTLRAPGTATDALTALDVTFTPSTASLAEGLRGRDEAVRKLTLLDTQVPAVAVGLGALLTLAALAWLRLRR